jgi:hypothetical protein
MRLVHHKERDIRSRQALDRLLSGELLGSQEQELELLVRKLRQALLSLALCHRGVDRGRLARLLLLDVVDLVALERDQRRDHERRALDRPAGELVDGRLAGAGGHHHERVAAARHGANGLLLARAQIVKSESLACEATDAVRGRAGHVVRSYPRGRRSPIR